MINTRKTLKQEIIKLIKIIKKRNKKHWLERVTRVLEKRNFTIGFSKVCSINHFSGEVIEKRKVVKIFSYGNQIRSRSGYTYNIYPVLIVNKEVINDKKK